MKGILKCQGSSKWQVKSLDTESGKWIELSNRLKPLLNKEIHHQKECEYHMDGNEIIIDTVDGKPLGALDAIERLNAEAEKQRQEKAAKNNRRERLGKLMDMESKKKQNRGLNIIDTRLPANTKESLVFLRDRGDLVIDNFALKLNKVVNFQEDKGVEKPILYRQKIFEINHKFSADFFEGYDSRQQRLLSEIYAGKENDYSVISLPVQNRLIHGLGNASVFETSMTLHHVYGIPYLPASSIKGVVRSWVIRNCFWQEAAGEGKRSKASEEAAMQDPLFAYIFGKDTSGHDKQAQQGHIIFFDAFPQSPPVIEPDIMNVHYPKYYGGTGLPVDYDSPNPIPFLTVGKCDANGKPLHFKFYVACKERDDKPEIKGNMIDKAGGKLSPQNTVLTVLDVVNYWLHSALSSHGIGAKTAVGYGYMKSI